MGFRSTTIGLDAVLGQMEQTAAVSQETAQEMVQAGADAATECWKASAQKHGHVRTGGMLESIGPTDIKEKNGLPYCEVYPKGSDKRGVRQMAKADYLNRGTSRIQADHWVDEAQGECKAKVPEAMKAAWEKAMSNKK